MKNLFYPLLIATAFVAAACTNNQEDDVTPVDPTGKTPISFVGETVNKAITRAGFDIKTQIAMHILSNEKGGSGIRETRTYANALEAAGEAAFSNIEAPNSDNVRYWDDAFGRSAQLSVFAVAVPGLSDVKNGAENKTLVDHLSGDNTWSTKNLDETVTWTVSTDQSVSGKIDAEDLVYSNNIQGDNKLIFRQPAGSSSDGPGTFDQGNLKFTHALSRITVNLKKDASFTETNSFQFNSNNVTVLNVPYSGDLNLIDGTWNKVTKGDIEKMLVIKTKDGYNYSLRAQFLPDYEISSTSTTPMLTFTIDDNQYFVTQAQMYDALKSATGMSKKDDSKITMEQGLNYNFLITVGKTSIINVTAEVEPWANVEAANFNPSNARITLDGVYDARSGEYSKSFTLYRLLDLSSEISDNYVGKRWDGDYTETATLTDNEDNSWSTNWYFESNKTYYHFRIVNEGTEIVTTADKDYFVIYSDASVDPHWGAPMISEPVYNVEKGFEASLSPAIGATNAKINITDQHMMSNIIVKLSTTEEKDQVTLAGCKVFITKLYNKGQVQMGNGLVTPTESLGQLKMNDNGDGTMFTYAVVPQALVRSTEPKDDDYIGITIVTADNNQYYIVKKLSEIVAEKVDNEKNQKKDNAILRWYPGHTYTYHFTLKKTGIDKITCTVEGWKNIDAKEQTITLED